MKNKFFISFLISLVIFTSAYYWIWNKIDGNGLTVAQAIEKDAGIDQVANIEEGNEIKQVNIDEVFFLLVGVDISDVKDIKEQKNGFTGIRSDTMMLCKANFKDGSIKIMSLPRDSRVLVKGARDKLGHAHSYGGMKLLMKTVRDLSNLDLDYYVRVDYRAVEKLVDAIGGIEIDVPQKMYKDGGVYLIDIEKGLQTLDGHNAMMFLRFRDYPDGDIARIKAQQYFLTELIKQTLAPKNVLKLPQILNVYSNYVDSNMDTKMIYSGISMAGKLDRDNIETTTLPGEFLELYPDGVKTSYWRVYEKSAAKEFKELFGEYIIK